METNTENRKKRLNNLYRQILIYIVSMLFLTFINYNQTPGHWWVIWPAAGWGLAILLQAIYTFFPSDEEDD